MDITKYVGYLENKIADYVEFRTMPSRSKNYRSIRPLTAFGLGIIRTA
jgi:hypothetical protein